MVLPLLAAGAIGIAGTALGEYLAGGSKKDMITNNTTRTSQDVYHAPYETYAPSIQYAPQSSYAYQGATYVVNSPNSSVNPKQAAALTSNPNQVPTYDIPQTNTPTNTTSNPTGNGLQGIDFTMIAIVGAVAVIGYALFKKG
jgi:hypothetical protein